MLEYSLCNCCTVGLDEVAGGHGLTLLVVTTWSSDERTTLLRNNCSRKSRING